jgi:hypothetical protein
MERNSDWPTSSLQLRPTFELNLPMPVEQANRALREILSQDHWKVTSAVFDRYAELHIPKQEQRFWSPHLSLYLEADDNEAVPSTRIFGRFAPRQEVWTLVWVAYLALAFSAFFSIVYVYAVSLLKQSTWMSVVPIASLIGIAWIHLASRMGQSWSTDQMHRLRSQCDQLIKQINDVR